MHVTRFVLSEASRVARYALVPALLLPHSARGYYNELIPGVRAAGMGGAFCAVADEPTAVLFNPGGVAFFKSSEFTGSSTGLHRVSFRDSVGFPNLDTSEVVPTFAGGVYQMKWPSTDMNGGFGLYTESYMFFDLKMDLSKQTGTNDFVLKSDGMYVGKFIGRSYGGVLNLAKLFGDTLGIGLSLGTRFQNSTSQYSMSYTQTFKKSGVLRSSWSSNSQLNSIDNHLVVGALKKIGDDFRFGFALTQYYNLTQKSESENYIFSVLLSEDQKTVSGQPYDEHKKVESRPIPKLRHMLRAGVSYQFNESLGAAFDVVHYPGLVSRDVKNNPEISTRTLRNYSFGVDSGWAENWDQQFGIFTNFDTSMPSEDDKPLDLYGASTALSYKWSETSYALTAVYQRGSGPDPYTDSKKQRKLEIVTLGLGVSTKM